MIRISREVDESRVAPTGLLISTVNVLSGFAMESSAMVITTVVSTVAIPGVPAGMETSAEASV